MHSRFSTNVNSSLLRLGRQAFRNNLKGKRFGYNVGEIFREMIKGYSGPQLNHLVQSIALIRYIRAKL